MLFAETLTEVTGAKRSSVAQAAIQRWQQKSNDMMANGVGYGLLGKGVDFRISEKEAFYTDYLVHNKI